MLTNAMAALLRLYTDEPDQSFQDDANIALWLELAYNDFRSIVTEIDPTVYARSEDFNVASSNTLSLASITGATVTAPRLDTILWLSLVEGSNETVLREGNTIQDITHGSADYILLDTNIRFPMARTGLFRLYYVPAQDVTWITAISAGNHLDELTRFHDMIPLIAYLQYAVMDAADHPQQLLLLQRRQEQLRHYLSYRSGSATELMVDSRWMEP